MGTISGTVIAKCKECQCRFIWSLRNWPFMNAEIVGTCNNCYNKKTHDCFDEIYIPHKKVGRKVFDLEPITERVFLEKFCYWQIACQDDFEVYVQKTWTCAAHLHEERAPICPYNSFEDAEKGQHSCVMLKPYDFTIVPNGWMCPKCRHIHGAFPDYGCNKCGYKGLG